MRIVRCTSTSSDSPASVVCARNIIDLTNWSSWNCSILHLYVCNETVVRVSSTFCNTTKCGIPSWQATQKFRSFILQAKSVAMFIHLVLYTSSRCGVLRAIWVSQSESLAKSCSTSSLWSEVDMNMIRDWMHSRRFYSFDSLILSGVLWCLLPLSIAGSLGVAWSMSSVSCLILLLKAFEL